MLLGAWLTTPAAVALEPGGRGSVQLEIRLSRALSSATAKDGEPFDGVVVKASTSVGTTDVVPGTPVKGTVLYATAQMYDYAYGRHTSGDENNEIWALLNGQPIFKSYRVERRQCTGTHICRPIKNDLSAKDVLAFQP